MRCPECRKFVSYDEPEVEDRSHDFETLQSDRQIRVTAEIWLGLNCAECSTELKSTDFEFDELVDIKDDHTEDEWHDADVTFEDPIGFDESQWIVPDPKRPGKTKKVSRFPRTLYGAEMSYTITIGEEVIEGTFKDTIQASQMEESV